MVAFLFMNLNLFLAEWYVANPLIFFVVWEPSCQIFALETEMTL